MSDFNPTPLDSLANQVPNVVIVPDTEHDRYATFQFITWWQPQKLRDATVLVVGAGALGNEVLKNLAQVGIGRAIIVDSDHIEMANLTRSILFRERDAGRAKADAAADSVRDINPDVRVKTVVGTVQESVGFGVYRHVDVVIGCVDNREARRDINRACWHVGRAWVDGAIQELLGEARVFVPGVGACYECQMSSGDYAAINARYSCNMLAHAMFAEGKIATTPTIAAIIGGMQAQEALKILHDLPVKSGQGIVFNGLTNDVYPVRYSEKGECLSHDRFEPVIDCPTLSHDSTVRQALDIIRAAMGERAVIELDFEVLTHIECTDGTVIPVVKRASTVNDAILEQARAQCAGEVFPVFTHTVTGSESFLDRTLHEIGVPPLHILSGRIGTAYQFFELTGDRQTWFTF
jgi:adenylyltransferase/sulfurtransferase